MPLVHENLPIAPNTLRVDTAVEERLECRNRTWCGELQCSKRILSKPGNQIVSLEVIHRTSKSAASSLRSHQNILPVRATSLNCPLPWFISIG